MASSTSDFKLSSRWMYALLFGVPVAAYIGYRFTKTSDTPSDKTSKDSKSTSTDGTSNGNNSTIKSEDPTDRARDHKLEGNKHFKLGQYEKAIERYTQAIKECPKSESADLSTFYQNRAAAYEQLRQHERVVEDCSSAIDLNPKYLKALQRRANAYEKLNRLADALDDVTAVCLMEAFQNESSLVQADRVLKELGRQHAKEAMEKKQPVLPSATFIKAFLSSFSQDPIVQLIASKESQPSENLSGFERAKQALINQEYSQVVPACTEAINDSVEADSQTTVGALLLRATFYMMMGEQKNAIADLEAVIDNDQADLKHRVNALIKRASLHIQQNDPAKCLEDYERAMTLDPKNPDIYHHRGQMEVLMDKAEEAMRDFEKAVELNPDYPMACAQKCYTDFRYKYLVARNMSAVDEIIGNFHDAIKRFPKCTECYMLLAQALSDLERFEDADKYFAKAMEIDPTNPTLYVHRGILQLRWKDNTDEAVKMLNKAIKLDEKCEFAYETLGTIEVQRGRMEKAIELFDTAIPLAKSETEMSHLFSLRDAAVSQARVAARMGVFIPTRT